MANEAIIGFGTSVLLALVPFLPAALFKLREKRDPQYFVGLVDRRDELLTAIEKQKQANAPEFVLARLDAVLETLDHRIRLSAQDVGGSRSGNTLSLFNYLVAAEGFLVIGSFVGSSQMQAFITGKSWQTKIYFFEGIFKYPIARVVLLLACFGLAFSITSRMCTAVQAQFKGRITSGFVLLGLFNAVFLGVVVVVSLVFMLADPVTVMW